MTHHDSEPTRAMFAEASRAFLEIVEQIGTASWDRPALGVWSVRDLVGHTSRSLVTVESYLGRLGDAVDVLEGPIDYYRAVQPINTNKAAVAQRGRDAGAALGDNPARFIADLRRRVLDLVEGASDDAPVGTPFGVMTLDGYLPTRVFELAVHTLDLAHVLGVAVPEALTAAVGFSCELAGRLAAEHAEAPAVLMALTGRTSLPPGFSIV